MYWAIDRRISGLQDNTVWLPIPNGHKPHAIMSPTIVRNAASGMIVWGQSHNGYPELLDWYDEADRDALKSAFELLKNGD